MDTELEEERMLGFRDRMLNPRKRLGTRHRDRMDIEP